MRTHYKPPTALALMFCLLPLVGILSASGCGSGSDSDNLSNPAPTATATSTPTPPSTAPVTVKAGIIWGPRSRQAVVSNGVSGPSSALSARIILTSTSAAANGANLTFTVNRTVQNGREVYTSAQAIRPGVYLLRVEFYAQTNGAGAIVGIAQASASVLADGNLSTTIATTGTIKSVEVPANQAILVGQTFALAYTPRDAAGNVIAVTPGSAFVNVTSGTDKLRAQGEDITGLAPPRATVTVTVDDAISVPTDVLIRSNAQVSVSPNPASVPIGLSQMFSATVTNDPTSSGVVWDITDANGQAITNGSGGTLSSVQANAVTYTAPSAAGTYILRARSVFDNLQIGTARITVVAGTVPVIVD